MLVFDLDGTLVDSRRDLCQAVNATMLRFGRPQLPDEVIAGYIGDGAEALIQRSLDHPAQLPQAQADQTVDSGEGLRYFLHFYDLHKLDHTRVYSGVLEALASIQTRLPLTPMACLTNKPVKASKAICAYLGLDQYFFQIYGGNSFSTKKPHPQGLLTLITEAAAITGRPIYCDQVMVVGDSSVDVLTARNCGGRSIGCLYGLAPDALRDAHPDYLVEHPRQWLQVLGLEPETLYRTTD